jgi:hypothetical protein
MLQHTTVHDEGHRINSSQPDDPFNRHSSIGNFAFENDRDSKNSFYRGDTSGIALNNL